MPLLVLRLAVAFFEVEERALARRLLVDVAAFTVADAAASRVTSMAALAAASAAPARATWVLRGECSLRGG